MSKWELQAPVDGLDWQITCTSILACHGAYGSFKCIAKFENIKLESQCRFFMGAYGKLWWSRLWQESWKTHSAAFFLGCTIELVKLLQFNFWILLLALYSTACWAGFCCCVKVASESVCACIVLFIYYNFFCNYTTQYSSLKGAVRLMSLEAK